MALATTARPMPVLPAVPSTMVPPGRKCPARDRVVDDEQRGAVLDRLAGIEEFRLAQNLAAGRLGGALQADQRRVADGGDDVMLDGRISEGMACPEPKGRTSPLQGFESFQGAVTAFAKSTIGAG